MKKSIYILLTVLLSFGLISAQNCYCPAPAVHVVYLPSPPSYMSGFEMQQPQLSYQPQQQYQQTYRPNTLEQISSVLGVINQGIGVLQNGYTLYNSFTQPSYQPQPYFQQQQQQLQQQAFGDNFFSQ